MKSILILLDYRDQFWLTTRHRQASFAVNEMAAWFEKHGYRVVVKRFSQIDFSRENYQGWHVLYQSTEDPYLLYNGFIEDCLLALQEQGAELIPAFKYNRAHHNKVFMEMLRTLSGDEEIKSLQSRWFGTFDEYLEFCRSSEVYFPHIVKLSEGSGSRNVIKIECIGEAGRVRKLMTHRDWLFWLKDKIKGWMPKLYPDFRPQTNARRKIVVQPFIEGLDSDYKVLVFLDRYYVLRRGNRTNDFRASGSGIFEFPSELPDGFLAYAKRVFDLFRVPFISMDLAWQNGKAYLIEFQFDSFGTYALEKSQWHFEETDGNWCRIDGAVVLEREFCRAVDGYLVSRLSPMLVPRALNK